MTWFVVHLYECSNFKSKLSLARLAFIDTLTRLLNRSTLQTLFDKFKKEQLTIVIFDIDHFKKINDTFGHEAGNNVLKQFSENLFDYFADYGYVFRLGGEEFCVLLKNAPNKEVLTLLKNFQKQNKLMSPSIISVNGNNEQEKSSYKIHFSTGIAFPSNNAKLQSMMNIADKNVYVAKNSGQNCSSVNSCSHIY